MFCVKQKNLKPLISVTSFTSQFRYTHIAVPNVLDYDLFLPPSTSVTASSKGSKIPPIIFLHGLLGNRKNNRSASKQFATQLRTPLIVPDLRNHGTSFHSEPMNYLAMSNDITNLINNLPSTVPRHRGFILMGHSMGAKAAMIHSLRFPKLVKGVVAVDNTPYRNPENSYFEFEKFHIGINAMLSCLKKHPDWTLDEMKHWLLTWVEPNEKVVIFWLTNIVRNKDGKLVEKIPLSLLNNHVEDILEWKLEEYGDIEPFAHQANVAPLLIVKGNYSSFVGNDIHSNAIGKFFNDWEVKGIDSGHWLVTERKAEFVKTVVEWSLRKFAH